MEWKTESGLTPYEHALSEMDARVKAIQHGAEDFGWLVQHPPLYTLGTSAKPSDILNAMVPSFTTGRGGQVTYHGPGQRVAYVMRDLKRHAASAGGEPDLRLYVQQLEQWIITTLKEFGVDGFVREGRVGVWVNTPKGEAKIAALGVRIQKWVTSHGIAVNVNPDLSHYAGIVPCGIREFGVTSLADLGVKARMAEVDEVLESKFNQVFK